MKKSLILLGMLSIGYANAQSTDSYEGRVGINTAEPSASLSVKTRDDAKSPKNLELQNQAGTKLVTVLNNGNVGVGTDSPNTSLHIDTQRDGGVASIQLNSYGLAANRQWSSNYLIFNRARGKQGALEAVQQDDQIGIIGFNGYNGTDYAIGPRIVAVARGEMKDGLTPMSLEISMPSHITKSFWNRSLVMDHTGYVGINIGELVPQAPLHVFGSRAITDFTDEEKENYKKSLILVDLHNWIGLGQHPTTKEIKSSISSSMYGFKPKFRAHSIDFGLIDLDTTTNPFMAFSVAPNLGYPTDKDETIERMRITSAGNVGIGTSTPTEKLEVVGNIKTSSLAQTGAGDRVVYADENGVLKAGVAASANVKLATANNVECTAANTGTMNFGSVNIGGQATEAFGFCMKNSTGEYKWYYIYGGAGITTGSGAFGSNL